MLESNSINQSWYCFNFYVPNSINTLMKRGMEEIVFFFQPEDTTGTVDLRHSDRINIKVNKTRNAIHVLLWIAISVAAALAVGQLK